MKGLDKYVVFSISCLLIYTIACIIITLVCGVQMDTLTTCFFGFFGGEVVTCALIKIFKLKGEQHECDTKCSELCSEDSEG